MKMKTKMPINRIKIGGDDILNIDLNQGWEITDVDFDDSLPSYMLNELVVTFRKTVKDLAYKQEVEIVQEQYGTTKLITKNSKKQLEN